MTPPSRSTLLLTAFAALFLAAVAALLLDASPAVAAVLLVALLATRIGYGMARRAERRGRDDRARGPVAPPGWRSRT